jgi:hypothetical protein
LQVIQHVCTLPRYLIKSKFHRKTKYRPSTTAAKPVSAMKALAMAASAQCKHINDQYISFRKSKGKGCLLVDIWLLFDEVKCYKISE